MDGNRACPGASRSCCRGTSITAAAAERSPIGRRPDFRRADGGALPAQHEAYLLFPSGARGPAFLVTENFVAIKRYNNSDVYALAVAHLADRLRGSRPFAGRWPASDPQLSRADRMRIQRRLAELGYKVSDFYGRFDFDQRDAIRDQQTKTGMVPDGHADPAFLEALLKPERASRQPRIN